VSPSDINMCIVLPTCRVFARNHRGRSETPNALSTVTNIADSATHTVSGVKPDLTGRDGQHLELTTARCVHGKSGMLTAFVRARCEC
jgi:hypothetical protein